MASAITNWITARVKKIQMTNQEQLKLVASKPSEYSLGEIATICKKAAQELETYKRIIGEVRDAFKAHNEATK